MGNSLLFCAYNSSECGGVIVDGQQQYTAAPRQFVQQQAIDSHLPSPFPYAYMHTWYIHILRVWDGIFSMCCPGTRLPLACL